MTRESPDSADAMARWETQARKGVLEMIILLSLQTREKYGFELISGIARRSALELSEGTLYPLLLRLAKDGLISSRLAGGDGGAPRKYYALTPAGRSMLDAMTGRWRQLAGAVETLLQPEPDQ